MGEFIKCCPFCGSHKVDICRTNENACWVRCANCSSEAESFPTREQAIVFWNRRYNDDNSSIIDFDDESK